MEAAHTGPSNVTTVIIIISNIIITLLLLQTSTEPNDVFSSQTTGSLCPMQSQIMLWVELA